MAKKTITITLETSDISLPEHLQKPPELQIKIEGMDGLEAVNHLSSVLTQILSSITPEIVALTNKNNSNPILKTVN